jgi:hypothetical protein
MKQSKHVHQHETRFDEGNLMVSLVAVQFSEPSNCGNERPFVGWEEDYRTDQKDVLYISFRTLQDPESANILQPSERFLSRAGKTDVLMQIAMCIILFVLVQVSLFANKFVASCFLLLVWCLID